MAYVCAEPGCPVIMRKPGRCTKHRRRSPTDTANDTTERRRRSQLKRQWIAQHGLTCAGWQRPPHAVQDAAHLTAAHDIPARDGGTEIVAFLCPSCNSRMGTQRWNQR